MVPRASEDASLNYHTSQPMGDSRICSRGFLEVIVHGALARRKIFHFTTPNFYVNFCACHDTIAKDSPKV